MSFVCSNKIVVAEMKWFLFVWSVQCIFVAHLNIETHLYFVLFIINMRIVHPEDVARPKEM